MNDDTPTTKGQLDALEERLLARIEKAETHLLTEFRLLGAPLRHAPEIDFYTGEQFR